MLAQALSLFCETYVSLISGREKGTGYQLDKKSCDLLPRDATHTQPGRTTGWDSPMFKTPMQEAPVVFNNKNGVGCGTTVRPKNGTVSFAI